MAPQSKKSRANDKAPRILGLEDDPLWFKDAIIYEVHVRAYYDSDGDGVGDFRGLTEKLDYIHDLGVTAVWLLPFCASPLKDEGYDISDYTAIHPMYGSMRDVRVFMREAHARGLRVITELVVNHTSDQHPWFQRSRRAAPGSTWRNFYVWSDTPEKYRGARIIFGDFEASNWTWDPVAKAYYWHRFYSHQPDINFDEPAVRKAVFDVVDFWMEMGVDGLRLDAVPYLYEREGTNCENLPETHALLKDLRSHVDSKFRNRIFLAEANQWPEDAVAYFGNGDESHMNFHFPLMPRLFMAIRMGDSFPVIDIMQQTPAIPENCQWALFLRNHDELTLEMVTEDERDYMWRAYASDAPARLNLGIRRRLAPLLGNDRKKIELMASMLLSLPGTPVIYYGDEIGMGDNIYLGDRNGVRTPMQWSIDRNAGFSRGNPQRLYLPIIIDPEYRPESVNVENQQNNPNSLLWWTKRLISLRKRYKVFGRGSIEFLRPENRRVLAFIRSFQDQQLLVVANLSRFAQSVELDLGAYAGRVPLELFGQTRFEKIGEEPYSLTLAAFTFYWLLLEPAREAGTITAAPADIPTLQLRASSRWDGVLRDPDSAQLEYVLPNYLRSRRWFLGRTLSIQAVQIERAVPVPGENPAGYLVLLRAVYRDGEPERYLLPIAFASGEPSSELRDAGVVIARVENQRANLSGVLYDAMWSDAFASALLEIAAARDHHRAESSELRAAPTPAFRPLLDSVGAFLQPSVVKAMQSNTSVVFGDLFILKLFRRIEEGPNPDFELGRFLTESTEFRNVVPLASAVELRGGNGTSTTLAVLNSYLPNQGDGWALALDTASRYFEDVLARPDKSPPPMAPKPLVELAADKVPDPASELMGMLIDDIRLLGKRTAEFHLALSSATADPDLAPEPLSAFYLRGQYQAMLSLVNRTLPMLRRGAGDLPEPAKTEAGKILALESELRKRMLPLKDRSIEAVRIRCHGDYHLGQVLYTGRDFVIFDLEGEVYRPLSVRRLKRSPVRDLAGMIRSFHYAAYTVLFGHFGTLRPEDFGTLDPWARYWHRWASAAFLGAWLESAKEAPFVPKKTEDLELLLQTFMLEKAIYEIGHDLQDRPEFLRIPLHGVLQLLEQ